MRSRASHAAFPSPVHTLSSVLFLGFRKVWMHFQRPFCQNQFLFFHKVEPPILRDEYQSNELLILSILLSPKFIFHKIMVRLSNSMTNFDLGLSF